VSGSSYPANRAAQRFRERVSSLGELRIDQILYLEASQCRRSLEQLQSFAQEVTQLTDDDLTALEAQVAKGLIAHARDHVSALLRDEGAEALSLLDEFDRSPSLDRFPDLLGAIKDINVARADPLLAMRAALATAFETQPEVEKRLALLAGRWLSGGMRRDRPAGSAVIAGPYGCGRSRLVAAFHGVLKAQGLAGDSPIEEIDLRDFAVPERGVVEFLQRVTELAQESSRRVFVFDYCDLALPAVKEELRSLAATGSAASGDAALSLDDKFLFFIVARDPAATLGAAFLRAVQEIIELPPLSSQQLQLMVAAEADAFARDFSASAGVTLAFDPAVPAHLVTRILEQGGFGHAVSEVVQQWLRLPVADLLTQGVLRARTARVVIQGERLHLEQGQDRIELPSVGAAAGKNPTFDFDTEINKLVGLEPVKEMLRAVQKQLIVDQRRRNAGLVQRTDPARHMLFLGNPGTGKTTVARIVARMLRELGVLREGQLVEVTRADLVAEYVGHTARRTLDIVRQALGGVLFIDEAYALTRGEDSFGREAVDTLVREIENHRDDLVVILAGYTKEMAEFLDSNSGLKSRFPNRFEFPDYTAAELVQIARLEAQGRGFCLADGVESRLVGLFEEKVIAGRTDQGNGRLARTIVEAAITRQSSRIADRHDLQPEELQKLMAQDFGVSDSDAQAAETEKQNTLAELDEIVGLQSVKDFVRDLAAEIKASERRRSLDLPVENSRSLHLVFKGNPGTGKTTIARIIGRLLKDLKILKLGHVVEVSRSGLVAGYVGQTALKTQERIREALGGLLFIDEAHALADGDAGSASFGREALDTLVKGMEDHRESLIVVLAGYPTGIERLLDQNPGLRSRFPSVIEFEDYSKEEMFEIAQRMLRARSLVATEAAKNRIRIACEAAAGDPVAGNGRFVRNLVEGVLRRQARRLANVANLSREDLMTLELDDIAGVSVGP
jgi:SpoVK/Ycf46/Vps4 family AAA+-type ATPase/energy-coupling factor transporter ATP-binding protein EcfA2